MLKVRIIHILRDYFFYKFILEDVVDDLKK